MTDDQRGLITRYGGDRAKHRGYRAAVARRVGVHGEKDAWKIVASRPVENLDDEVRDESVYGWGATEEEAFADAEDRLNMSPIGAGRAHLADYEVRTEADEAMHVANFLTEIISKGLLRGHSEQLEKAKGLLDAALERSGRNSKRWRDAFQSEQDAGAAVGHKRVFEDLEMEEGK